ncbi:hypothetical protein Tco_1011286, partial [Tanacetum coccineum]
MVRPPSLLGDHSEFRWLRLLLPQSKYRSSPSDPYRWLGGVIPGIVYHDLYLGGKALVYRENVGLDLTKSDLCPSFVEDHPVKGVCLRVADSHTGNLCKFGFTPLETILSIAGGLDPVSPVIRLPIECGYNREMSNAGQPETTIDEYLTKVRDDSGPGIVKPSFEENIKFEFRGQSIGELKENIFFGSMNEDPHKHNSNITDIINVFHSPRLSRDQEWFNESLYNCPEHKINEHKQLQVFYQGLDTETRRKVDFKGPIPRMTPTAKIKAIIELSRHSLSWYKEGDFKNNDLNIVFGQINNFEQNMNNITEEVRMVQHKYKLPYEEKNSKPEETLRTFIEESRQKQKQNESLFWKIKKNCEKVFKKQASSVKLLKGTD